MDIVGRTAPETAVQRVLLLVELGQHRLDERGGRPDQRREPHPEHRPRAAGGYGRHHADQVAHAHPGGGGHDEGLDAGDGRAVFGAFFRRHPEHLREHTDGEEPGPDGEINSSGDEHQHQQGNPQRPASRQGDGKQVAPEQVVCGGDGVYNELHVGLLGFTGGIPARNLVVAFWSAISI